MLNFAGTVLIRDDKLKSKYNMLSIDFETDPKHKKGPEIKYTVVKLNIMRSPHCGPRATQGTLVYFILVIFIPLAVSWPLTAF